MKSNPHFLWILLCVIGFYLLSDCSGPGVPVRQRPAIIGAGPIQPTLTPKRILPGEGEGPEVQSGGVESVVQLSDLKVVDCNAPVNRKCDAKAEQVFKTDGSICITWKEQGRTGEVPGALQVYLYENGSLLGEGQQYEERGSVNGVDECQWHKIADISSPEAVYRYELYQVQGGNRFQVEWRILKPEPTPTPTNTAAPTTAPTPKYTMTPSTSRDLVAYSGLVSPAIDGDLSEWVLFPRYESAFVTNTSPAWDGTDDIRAVWSIAWDEKYLFVGVMVEDDLIQPGDSLLMEFDTSTQPGKGPLNEKNIFFLSLTPGNFKDQPPKADIFQMFTPKEGQSTMIQSRQLPQGYSIEAAVAWDNLEIKAAPGQIFGVALNAIDVDDPSKGENQMLKSHVSGYKLLDPTTFGMLYLK